MFGKRVGSKGGCLWTHPGAQAGGRRQYIAIEYVQIDEGHDHNCAAGQRRVAASYKRALGLEVGQLACG